MNEKTKKWIIALFEAEDFSEVKTIRNVEGTLAP
jgi:hypothetical protein